MDSGAPKGLSLSLDAMIAMNREKGRRYALRRCPRRQNEHSKMCESRTQLLVLGGLCIEARLQ